MKKSILILALAITGFSFSQQRVQLTLQEGNFTSNNGSLFYVNYITDAGLNQILSNYNAYYNSEILASCSLQKNIIVYIPSTASIANFVNDLNAYNTVVLNAQAENNLG